MVNVLLALDQHLTGDLEEAEAEAEAALERYVTAQQRCMELRAALSLRRAMGGQVRSTDTLKLETA